MQNAMPRKLVACDRGRARFGSSALFGAIGSADCKATLSADQLPARYVPPNHPGRPYSDLPEMMMRWRSRQCLQNGMAHPTPRVGNLQYCQLAAVAPTQKE